MYCPKCRSEYRPGFYHCPDCDEALVYELAEESAGDPGLVAPVAVFSTQNPGEVLLIQSILDADGIPYYFKGELFLGSGMYVTPSILIISEQDESRALEILKDNGLV